LPPTIVPAPIKIEDTPNGLIERIAIASEHFSGFLPPPDLPPPKNAA
jgi:hypothetical protein